MYSVDPSKSNGQKTSLNGSIAFQEVLKSPIVIQEG